MSWYVGMYVSHCNLCLRTKIQRRLPTGELQPLPIPEEHWDVISVDFISELPESGGYDSIMVAVDSAGKCSHFVEMVTTVSVRFGSGSGKNLGTRPDPGSRPIPESLGLGSYPGGSGNRSGNGNIILIYLNNNITYI